MIWRTVVPFAEPLWPRRRLKARRSVDIAEGEDVLSDGRIVGLLNAWKREGPRYKLSGSRI